MGNVLWHAMPVAEALKQLESNPQGLSREEAARRLERFGPNTLKEEKRISPWEILLAQFKNFLILLLIAATVISIFLGETLDAIVIFAIVIASALLGFYQEYRAEKALQALKAMASPTASVLRGGEEVEIPSSDVVPGDIMLLAAGDRMPADGRLLLSANVRIDEASLTGESTAVGKDASAVLPSDSAIGDRKNMVFAATVMTYGRGQAVVTATGMETEFGRIAKMLQEVEEEPSPLAEKMDFIGKRLGVACLVVAALVMGLGILRETPPGDVHLGVSLAIAAVPEALAAVVTGALAIGVQRAAAARPLSAVSPRSRPWAARR
jgi:Ca2+-transporting ATPase